MNTLEKLIEECMNKYNITEIDPESNENEEARDILLSMQEKAAI